jgi:hypothetical protein
MEPDVEMLDYIQYNAEMKKNTLKKLIDTVDDQNFAGILAAQYDQYNDIFKKCEVKIQDSDLYIKEMSPVTKATNDLLLNIKTINDKTPAHIAEILIKDNTEGIIDLRKRIKENYDIPQDILDISSSLLQTEENSVEDMKKYL